MDEVLVAVVEVVGVVVAAEVDDIVGGARIVVLVEFVGAIRKRFLVIKSLPVEFSLTTGF